MGLTYTPTEGGHQAVTDSIRGIAALAPEQCYFAGFRFFKLTSLSSWSKLMAPTAFCVKGKARLDAGALFSASQQYLAQVAASDLRGAWADSLAGMFVSTEFKK